MANKRFFQFLFSPNPMLTLIDGGFDVGATGAVSGTVGNGISSITRLGVGTYRIKLSDSFNHFYDFNASMQMGVTGSALAIDAVSAALAIGTAYQITVVGDASAAQWAALGVADGVTPAVGVSFTALATGNGASSTARVKALAPSGIQAIELVSSPDLSIGNTTTPCIVIQCLKATDASTTTLIPGDPLSGSSMRFNMLLRNSSASR
jgi:hypothetical protein